MLCLQLFEVHHEMCFNCFTKFKEDQVASYKSKKSFKSLYTPCLSNREDSAYLFKKLLEEEELFQVNGKAQVFASI